MKEPYQLIVMGVSGCGKSTVGERIAQQLRYNFFDGDSYHPEANIKKMRQGQPLNDQDRQGWLTTLNTLLQQQTHGAVLACSALKPAYRDALIAGVVNPKFIYLKGDFDTIWERHQQRENHYFTGKRMLESQYDILVEPEGEHVITVDVTLSVDAIAKHVVAALM